MKKLDGSKENLSPVQSEEMTNSTEKMIHEELDSLSFQNCPGSVHHCLNGPSIMDRSVAQFVLVRLVSGSPRVIQKQIDENIEESDFQIIFDYLPKISWYQAGIVFMTGYSNVAGGSLQLAQKGFQIDESHGFISQSVIEIKFENRIKIILQANPDSKRCISSTASNLTLVRFHWIMILVYQSNRELTVTKFKPFQDQNGCDIAKQCTEYSYSSDLFNETVVTQVGDSLSPS